jgi:sulfoxide reductase heme-binding subunit YedZ
MPRQIKLNWPKIIVNLTALLPVIWLGFAAAAGKLGVNPIQRAEQLSGDFAIILLLLTLTLTPLRIITGWTNFEKFEKTLGLQTFYYASAHLMIFLWLDYQFAWTELVQLFLQKSFLWVGLSAFLILLVLAITSFSFWKSRLGKWWKRIHTLIYAAGVLVVLHYAWSIKGSLFLLRGAILKPLIAAGVVLILLVIRIKPVREAISSWRKNKNG